MARNTHDILVPVTSSDVAEERIEEIEVLDRTIQMYPPTVQQFGALQLAFNHFNRVLFDGQLPSCLLNLSRKRSAGGFFAPERWEKGDTVVHEISLNPNHLTPPMIEVMGTLVHEMAHLWQEEFGMPGRRGYHNVEWADKMEKIGLIPTATGKPGGKRIGDRMSHYIDAEGRFKQAFDDMPDRALLPWRTVIRRKGGSGGNGSGGSNGRGRKKSKVKYSCPSCSVNVWGKPDLQIRCGCGKSDEQFKETN